MQRYKNKFKVIIYYYINIILLDRAGSSNAILDKEHLKLYPYCGRIFGHESSYPKSRIVNSGDDTENELFPWVVYISHKCRNILNDFDFGTCSGTVITYNSMVTAGHCICETPQTHPNIHENAVCKPREHNQIEKGKNEINIYGGSKDKEFLKSAKNNKNSFEVDQAYLMDNPKNGEFVGTKDIGILLTKKSLFQKEIMQSNLSPHTRPPIIPMCLPAKDYDFDEKDIYGVGWGQRFDESPEGQDPFYSSCMTNEVGKEEWRFQACNMKQIERLKWSCEVNKLPPDISHSDRLQCRRFWINARRIFEKTDKSKIKYINRVKKIFIYKKGVPFEEMQDPKYRLTCYSEEQFYNPGWCEVHGQSSTKGAWGFCSPSCDRNLLKAGPKDSLARIYQKIDWNVDTNEDNICSEESYWDPDYMVCMKAKLPQTDVGIFETTKSFDELEFVSFKKEYGPDSPDFETSYLAPCKGDSGSGQWITIDKDEAEPWEGVKMNQMVLVAVYNTGIRGRYRLNGKYKKGVCGGDITFEDGKNLVAANYCTKVTNEEVLNFIKSYANIH